MTERHQSDEAEGRVLWRRRLLAWTAAGPALGIVSGLAVGAVVGLGLANAGRLLAAVAVGALFGATWGLIVGLPSGILTAVFSGLYASTNGRLTPAPQRWIPAIGGVVGAAVAVGPFDPLATIIPAFIAAVAGALAGPRVERWITRADV